jgi:hypothetical protein
MKRQRSTSSSSRQQPSLLLFRKDGTKSTNNRRRQHDTKSHTNIHHSLNLPTNLPDIPLEILPLHLQCIRICQQFMESPEGSTAPMIGSCRRSSDHPDESVMLSNTTTNTTTTTTTNPTTVMESVFHRMDVAEIFGHDVPKMSPQQQHSCGGEDTSSRSRSRSIMTRSKLDTATISSWLQSIHQYIRMRHHHHHHPPAVQVPTSINHNHSTTKAASVDSVVVPIALLQHLLRILLSPPKQRHSTAGSGSGSGGIVSTQRAVTYMMHQLLLKSAAGRQYFCTGDWTDHHTAPPKKNTTRTTTTTTTARQLLLVWMDTILALELTNHPAATAASTEGTMMTTTTTPHHNRSPTLSGAAVKQQQQQIWFLQYESYHLLQCLHNDYGHFYPTLTIAIQRFHLHGPIGVMSKHPNRTITTATRMTTTMTSTSTGPHSMVDWRHLRDDAIQNIDIAECRIQNLLQRALVCLDTLVPRWMAQETTATTAPSSTRNQPTTPKNATTTNMDTEDDDIDWEDGCSDPGGGDNDAAVPSIESSLVATTATTITTTPAISHLQAVEHTMATMKSIRGVLLLPEDELAIDFSRTDTLLNNTTDPHSSHTACMDPGSSCIEPLAYGTRMKLQKVVQVLQNKHMVRLSLWIDGLSQADHLVSKVVATTTVPSSTKHSKMTKLLSATQPTIAIPLVRMTPSQIQHQTIVLHRLRELKEQVASILTSASRLGIRVPDDDHV